MDVNQLITPAFARLVTDSQLPVILGETVKAVKGARRSKELTGNSFTVFLLSAPQDLDTKVIRGTLCINHYCPNNGSEIPNVELMGPVSERIEALFDDARLSMDNYNNYDITVNETLGPLFDPSDPEFHFCSTRINYQLKRRS